jgi:hypothetical protein
LNSATSSDAVSGKQSSAKLDQSAATSSGRADNPGSALASLWIRVSQEGKPPASVPSSSLPAAWCPQCNLRLALHFSGNQVCIKCGWQDKALNSILEEAIAPESASPSAELSDEELKKLLNQAASESLNNMKPRKKLN